MTAKAPEKGWLVGRQTDPAAFSEETLFRGELTFAVKLQVVGSVFFFSDGWKVFLKVLCFFFSLKLGRSWDLQKTWLRK